MDIVTSCHGGGYCKQELHKTQHIDSLNLFGDRKTSRDVFMEVANAHQQNSFMGTQQDSSKILLSQEKKLQIFYPLGFHDYHSTVRTQGHVTFSCP